MMEKQYICLKEAAQILGINERTMKKILEQEKDKLEFSKVGRRFLINKYSLLEYINNHNTIN